MSRGGRNSITSPSTATKYNHIPCKLYQDLLSIRINYYRILEDINLSKNDGSFTKDHIQISAQKLSKSQLLDHLSDILSSLQVICLNVYSDDKCIHEEYRHREKRIKTDSIEEHTRPILLNSQSCYKCDETSASGNDEKFSCDTSDIFDEYNIEEPDEISDTSEEQTNTETQASLPSEVKECRPDLIQCKKCSFKATLPSSMILHEAVHNRKQGELLCCSMCNYQTYKSPHFNCHICKHTGDKPLKCYHCDIHFSHSGRLSNHMTKEHPHLILKCEKCDFHGFNAATMKRHIELLHPETERKFVSCEKCKFTATKSLTIILHQATHTKKTGPFKCPECDYASSHKTNFNSHISVHTGDRRCVCKYCNAAFFSNNALGKHVRAVHHIHVDA